MYPEWGDVPAAGVVTTIGSIHGRPVMVVANDATVKAGAFFPQTVKKVLRAQRVAMRFRLPLVYLVDSAGVFLPLQDEIFPDEDDFGRIFRNNAVISASQIPQYAAVMGNCVAGGALLAGALRYLADYRRQPDVSRRSRLGQGGDRPGPRSGGTWRSENACGHQWHCRLSRTG